jgi:GH43 family beta-xylosidase
VALFYRVVGALFAVTALTGFSGCGGSGSNGGTSGGAVSDGGGQTEDGMIVNPVAPVGHDPFVTQKDGIYYYIYSHEGSIWINNSMRLEDAVQFDGQKIWTPPAGERYSQNIWAPELFFIDNKWFIYFAADDGDNHNHRMYALKSTTEDAFSQYELQGQVTDETDKWAIDGTFLEHQGQRYFIWSGWEGDTNVQQNLYIAQMSSPTEIAGGRVLISRPEYDWERVGDPDVNEGPQILKNGQHVFIVYSASGSWTDHYALGLLTLTGADPMEPGAWTKDSQPVFESTDTVFSPGHASFTKSPDGTEDWIVYHSARYKGAGWDRDVSMKPFYWNADGTPDFGEPVDKGEPIPAPSAEQ